MVNINPAISRSSWNPYSHYVKIKCFASDFVPFLAVLFYGILIWFDMNMKMSVCLKIYILNFVIALLQGVINICPFQPWCSTEVDDDGTHIGGKGKWGNCAPGCPIPPDDRPSPESGRKPEIFLHYLYKCVLLLIVRSKCFCCRHWQVNSRKETIF